MKLKSANAIILLFSLLFCLITFVKNKNSPPKFVHVKNTHLTESPEFISYKKCDHKFGFIDIVKKGTLERTRININLDNVLLFTNMDQKSQFFKLDLQNILKVSQKEKYLNTFCFDIVENNLKGSKLEISAVTLCGKDKNDMDSWVNTLREFKQCLVDGTNHEDKKVMVDFEKINKISVDDNSLRPLYYDNSLKTFRKGAVKTAEEHSVTKAVKTMMETIEVQHLKENKIKRQMADKLKTVRKFQKQIRRKNLAVNRELRRKMVQEINVKRKTEKLKTNEQEVNLIKAMAEKIKDIKVNH